MLNHVLRVLLVFGVLVSSLFADVSGKWKGQPEGADQEMVFTIKADGQTLSGSLSGPEGKDFPLKGKLDGDKISFTVDAEWQGAPIKLVANGTASDDEMKLTIGTDDGAWSSPLTMKRQ